MATEDPESRRELTGEQKPRSATSIGRDEMPDRRRPMIFFELRE